jgi:hypothetical protein
MCLCNKCHAAVEWGTSDLTAQQCGTNPQRGEIVPRR